MRKKVKKAIVILTLSTMVLVLGFVFLPGGEVPPVEQDVQRLRIAISSMDVGNCRMDKQRRGISNPNDEDDMASMMHSRSITQISMRCGETRVDATVATYRARFSPLWREKGLTQCGEGYCQKAWASGRQLFIVTTTEKVTN
ncbi:hypothetical protein [Solimonas fluminis]|uniref:hypothetical protein n=1 Tax=Solimonas fluminis TaxID=2086571 RepID=UPI0010575357|nr:hypothetical protein [Solimonas fluminis]